MTALQVAQTEKMRLAALETVLCSYRISANARKGRPEVTAAAFGFQLQPADRRHDMRFAWRATGPSGPMETTAATKAEAERNLRYRLHRAYRMSVWDARRFDFSDLHPKTPEESGGQYEGRRLTR